MKQKLIAFMMAAMLCTTVTGCDLPFSASSNVSENGDSSFSGHKAAALFAKIKVWKAGNVRIHLNIDGMGVNETVFIDRYDSMLYAEISVTNGSPIALLYANQKQYAFDADTKKMCSHDASAPDYALFEKAEQILDVKESNFIEEGKVTIGEKEYDYEQYSILADGKNEKFNFCFDDGKLVMVQSASTPSLYYYYSVELLNQPDQTNFAVPSGYTEVSGSEFAGIISGKMAGTLVSKLTNPQNKLWTAIGDFADGFKESLKSVYDGAKTGADDSWNEMFKKYSGEFEQQKQELEEKRKELERMREEAAEQTAKTKEEFDKKLKEIEEKQRELEKKQAEWKTEFEQKKQEASEKIAQQGQEFEAKKEQMQQELSEKAEEMQEKWNEFANETD